MANSKPDGDQQAAGAAATPPPAAETTAKPAEVTSPKPESTASYVITGWIDFYTKIGPILLLVGAAFASGVALGEHCSTENIDFLKGEITTLQKKLTDKETDLKQAREAQDILQNEIVVCNNATSNQGNGNASPSPQNHGAVSANTPTPPVPQNGELDIQVFRNQTSKAFSHQLFLTLVDTKPTQASPNRYEADVVFGAPNQPSAPHHVNAGDVVTYAMFEIRITQIDAISAWFHVRRLSPPPPSKKP